MNAATIKSRDSSSRTCSSASRIIRSMRRSATSISSSSSDIGRTGRRCLHARQVLKNTLESSDFHTAGSSRTHAMARRRRRRTNVMTISSNRMVMVSVLRTSTVREEKQSSIQLHSSTKVLAYLEEITYEHLN